MTNDDALDLIIAQPEVMQEFETYELTRPRLTAGPMAAGLTAVSAMLTAAAISGVAWLTDVDVGPIVVVAVLAHVGLLVRNLIQQIQEERDRLAVARRFGPLVDRNGRPTTDGQGVLGVLEDVRQQPIAPASGKSLELAARARKKALAPAARAQPARKQLPPAP